MSTTTDPESLADTDAWLNRDPVVKSLRERQLRLKEVLKLNDAVVQAHPELADTTETSEQRQKLAVTDLFVETALELLKAKADDYHKRGNIAFVLGILMVIFAIIASYIQLDKPSAVVHLSAIQASTASSISASSASEAHPAASTPKSSITSTQVPTDSLTDGQSPWIELLTRFIRAFTFFGLMVLGAVKLWQFSKAMLDQSERLFERRHALRQGRLFVHLKNGKISIEEMEKAFAWNLAQPNAFANIVADAKAPWGAALAELTKVLPELLKVGADAATRTRDSNDKKTGTG